MGGLLVMVGLGGLAMVGVATGESDATAAVFGAAVGAMGLIGIGINGFVLWVLWTRKDMFD